MNDPSKTNLELLEENALLKQRILEMDEGESDRKRAENQLQESLKQYRQLVDYAHDGIFTLDTHGRFLFANAEICNMLGYSREELLCLNILDTYPDAEQDTCLQRLDLLKRGESIQFERPMKCKDGRFIIIEATAWKTEEGNLQSIVRNITARKKTEQELEQQQRMLQTIIDKSRTHLVYLDKDFNFLAVNETYAQGCKRKPSELIGKNHFYFYPHEENEAIFRQVRDTGKSVSFHDKPFNFPDQPERGTTYWDWTLTPVKDSAGNVEGMVFSLVETTERKRMEEELRRSEIKFRSIYEDSPIGIELYDREGVLLDANRVCLEIFGISDVAAIKGFRLFEDPNLNEELKAQLRRGESVRYEIPFDFEKVRAFKMYETTRRGTIYLDLLITPSIDVTSESPIGYLVQIRDMTERKRAEEIKAKFEVEYRQMQKAESLGRMAGAIAHNFNNLLGVVFGNLELAMLNLPTDSDVGKNLLGAMKAAHRVADVSKLMLTYLGKTHSKHELLNLSEVWGCEIGNLRDLMPKEVDLEIDFPSSGPTIEGNSLQIRQALRNLVDNAREALDEARGSVHVAVKVVSPEEIPVANRFPLDWQPQDNPYACLEVRDTGCGISDTDIEKIFDPFFTSKFIGRGLGLPVALGIVREHCGAITVESKVGNGSVFRVFLPISFKTISVQPSAPLQIPQIKEGKMILLVEDEPALREVAKTMLNRLGFAVLEANDGFEAVDLFMNHQSEIRCVLCDLTMPRMDGWETLVELRKLVPGIPVILTSGYDKVRVMTGEHPEWPQAFLGKPYSLQELSDAISRSFMSAGDAR